MKHVRRGRDEGEGLASLDRIKAISPMGSKHFLCRLAGLPPNLTNSQLAGAANRDEFAVQAENKQDVELEFAEVQISEFFGKQVDFRRHYD